jgi:hypothetical protein
MEPAVSRPLVDEAKEQLMVFLAHLDKLNSHSLTGNLVPHFGMGLDEAEMLGGAETKENLGARRELSGILEEEPAAT